MHKVKHKHNQLSGRRTKKLKTRLHSTKWGREFRSNFSRTHPRDATGNNGHIKLRKMLQSNVKTKLDGFGNVVNLSDNLFSKSKFSVLNKNLNFCPRPNKCNKQNLNKDLLKFYRNIKLRALLGSTENNSIEPRFKNNSNCLPDKLPSCVETFMTAVNHDIKSPKTKKLPRDNLTKSEKEALFNLQKRNDIIITKPDKGRRCGNIRH